MPHALYNIIEKVTEGTQEPGDGGRLQYAVFWAWKQPL